ncbi:TetR/AcrR family transcriptional regulator [Noviherbaspirillum pedocola]|uniref:TetR/AcrR family transcriptional regulator n=1 Tax=Noviherbaspirillum pedocola TaxID=2801341 RepID=A0A934WAK4_9BURK|nr:TetR/AcrR family transcriptional regulator [Noviherbaspirillum pedocola]MBK4739239.1 TetR/AcrR family transcriptional regulator [Noviherbaspirillum pedocola]
MLEETPNQGFDNVNAPLMPLRRREAQGVRSEKRVKEILAVARQIFSAQGYERTTTLEIARQLEVSEATIFSYFVSKRDLCMRVIQSWYDEITLVLEQELPLIPGTRAKLHFVVHKHLVTLIQEGTGMCRLVLGEGRSTMDDEFATLIIELKRRYTNPLMKVLGSAQRVNEIRVDMPLPLLRDMVYGSMEHVLWDYVAKGVKPDIDKTAEQLTAMLWGAFTPVQQTMEQLARFHLEVAEALRRLEQS